MRFTSRLFAFLKGSVKSPGFLFSFMGWVEVAGGFEARSQTHYVTQVFLEFTI